MDHPQKKGYIVVLVLVFSAVFLTIVSSLAGFIFVQKNVQLAKENRAKGIQIAEAGLDYYKWFLAHFPNDLQDGTGAPGPYEHDYADPEGGDIGKFSLAVTGNQLCNTISSIDITSTGWTNADPTFTRTVFGKYARPSVAEFAYIINSNVWAGSDRLIFGPYHSNGGIRMDGDNRSTVQSGLEDWFCTSSFGCSPSQTQDGVFGAGTQPGLWEFPAAPIDFVGLTVDLANMKTQAQSDGIYLAATPGDPDERGYHLVFLSDGTVDVYEVTDTNWVWGYKSGTGWDRDYHTIDDENLIANMAIPAACPLIFAEAKVWVEGTLNGKVTLAAANVTSPTVDPDLILEGNIAYTALDGSVGLTAIGERSVLIPVISPDDMDVRGIFIAQNGNFGRNYYSSSNSPYHLRNSLTITGTIVSNGRVGTKWSCGGTYCSGYANRENYYDRNLATEPPPLTPYTSADYRFIEWREGN